MIKTKIFKIISPFWKKLLLASVLSGTSLFMAVGLLAASSWLISMASTRPPILTLQVAIVAVRFFGLGRGVFRYASRLVEHDAAFRIQGELRQGLYRSIERFTPTTFAGLKRGQLLRQNMWNINYRLPTAIRGSCNRCNICNLNNYYFICINILICSSGLSPSLRSAL